jgi:predicted transcriptional regulator
MSAATIRLPNDLKVRISRAAEAAATAAHNFIPPSIGRPAGEDRRELPGGGLGRLVVPGKRPIRTPA